MGCRTFKCKKCREYINFFPGPPENWVCNKCSTPMTEDEIYLSEEICRWEHDYRHSQDRVRDLTKFISSDVQLEDLRKIHIRLQNLKDCMHRAATQLWGNKNKVEVAKYLVQATTADETTPGNESHMFLKYLKKEGKV